MVDERCIGCGEASAIDCLCDCGQTIWVCKYCLAEDKVLTCGQCGIEEATDRANDFSIYWARLWVKENLSVADSKSALQGIQLRIEWLKREKKEAEDEKTSLVNEQAELLKEKEELKRLKARLEKEAEELDGESEEWKRGIASDED